MLTALTPHPSKKISDMVRGMSDVLDLTVGVPDYGPPKLLHDTLMRMLTESCGTSLSDFHRYADSRGVRQLRIELALRYKRRYGIEIDPDEEILITHGGAEAIWLTVFALTEPGDEVFLPDPCYMLYEPIVRSLGRIPVRVRGGADFIVRPDHLRPLVSRRSRLLMLNSPENPTGVVYERDDLSALAELAVEYGFRVMHDEVFDDHLFAGQHTPLIEVTPERDSVVMVNSFSKRFGMTGWRLGWLVASPEITRQAVKAHTYVSLATSALVQEAMAPVINDPDIERTVVHRVTEIRDKALAFADGLSRLPGFRLDYRINGGFYLFPDVSALLTHSLSRPAIGESAGETVARLLLDHCKIAVVPGIGFGPSGANHVRFSIAGARRQQKDALTRLGDLVEGF